MTAQAAEAAIERALALSQIGRNDDALAALVPGLSDPDTAWFAQAVRAQILVDIGRPNDAHVAVRRALQLAPQQEYPHRVAAHVLWALKQKKAALRAAQEAVRLDPDSFHTRLNLALLLLHRRRYKQADTLTRQLLAEFPDEPAVHVTLGQAAERRSLWRDRSAIARTHYREALRLDPTDAYAADRLAVLESQHGADDEVRHLLLASYRNQPDAMTVRKLTFAHSQRTQAGVMAGWIVAASLVLILVSSRLGDRWDLPGPVAGYGWLLYLGIMLAGAMFTLHALGIRHLPTDARPLYYRRMRTGILVALGLLAAAAIPFAACSLLAGSPRAGLSLGVLGAAGTAVLFWQHRVVQGLVRNRLGAS